MTVRIRSLAPEEWPTYRAVRLAALCGEVADLPIGVSSTDEEPRELGSDLVLGASWGGVTNVVQHLLAPVHPLSANACASPSRPHSWPSLPPSCFRGVIEEERATSAPLGPGRSTRTS